MGNRLSHSQAMKYQECSKAWEYHYVKKLRPTTISSALLFGNVLDRAVELYLLSRDKEAAMKSIPESWSKAEINGKEYELYGCSKVVYSNSDYDKDLITDVDRETLNKDIGEDWEEQFKSCVNQKAAVGFELLSVERKEIINKVNWFSMLRKGELMLLEAMRLIDENVEEVLGTQVEVSLNNQQGDSIIGFADFVVRWKGREKPVVMDLKTSSIRYDDNAVKVSPQLSLYVHDLEDRFDTNDAGFMVINKHINKNRLKICTKCGFDSSSSSHKTCPNEIDGVRCKGDLDIKTTLNATSQVLIDTIPKRLEEIVIENMDTVNASIKAGIYPRNLGACKKPWGLCAYYSKCYENSDKGLVNLT